MTARRSLLALTCLLLVGCGTTASTPSAKVPPAVDVSGKWSGTYATNVGPMPVELTLKQVDADVTGDAHIAGDSWTTSTYKGAIKGTVSGVTFSYTYPGGGGEVTVNARPGKNVTGLTIYAGGEVFAKLVELLHEIAPKAKRIGVLMSYVPPFHPQAETDLIIRGLQSAAASLRLDQGIYEIASSEQLDDAFALISRDGVEALVLTSDPVMIRRGREILTFAVTHRLPTLVEGAWRDIIEPRPLLIYSAAFNTLIRQSATYVNKILWQGAKPGDLPIQLPAKFEFVINLKTAKAVGMTIPPSVLARADQVIE